MKLKVTTAFNDMSIADADRRRREIGAEFEAEDMRAAQLAVLGFVEIISSAEHPAAPNEPAVDDAPAGATVTETALSPTTPVVALP